MEVVSCKGHVVENDSNLLSLVPEVEWLICYDWGGSDRPPSLLHFLAPTLTVGCFSFSSLLSFFFFAPNDNGNENATHKREQLGEKMSEWRKEGELYSVFTCP